MTTNISINVPTLPLTAVTARSFDWHTGGAAKGTEGRGEEERRVEFFVDGVLQHVARGRQVWVTGCFIFVPLSLGCLSSLS